MEKNVFNWNGFASKRLHRYARGYQRHDIPRTSWKELGNPAYATFLLIASRPSLRDTRFAPIDVSRSRIDEPCPSKRPDPTTTNYIEKNASVRTTSTRIYVQLVICNTKDVGNEVVVVDRRLLILDRKNNGRLRKDGTIASYLRKRMRQSVDAPNSPNLRMLENKDRFDEF